MTKHFTLFFTAVLLLSTAACSTTHGQDAQARMKTNFLKYKSGEDFQEPRGRNARVPEFYPYCAFNIDIETEYCVYSPTEEIDDKGNRKFLPYIYTIKTQLANEKEFTDLITYIKQSDYAQAMQKSYARFNGEALFQDSLSLALNFIKDKGFSWFTQIQPYIQPGYLMSNSGEEYQDSQLNNLKRKDISQEDLIVTYDSRLVSNKEYIKQIQDLCLMDNPDKITDNVALIPYKGNIFTLSLTYAGFDKENPIFHIKGNSQPFSADFYADTSNPDKLIHIFFAYSNEMFSSAEDLLKRDGMHLKSCDFMGYYRNIRWQEQPLL